MAVEVYDTIIQGYWRTFDIHLVPNHSGVYFVYKVSVNQYNKRLTFVELLYIGEAENVRDRIRKHEKYKEWEVCLLEGEDLCFSTCEVEGDERPRVEAAYIFKHKPEFNLKYKDNFPFDRTTVISCGRTKLMSYQFTVFPSIAEE